MVSTLWHIPTAANAGLAVTYSRISDTNTDLGVKRQQTACTERGSALGAMTFRHYCDNSKSATKLDVVRPDYERLIADIRSGALDGAMLVVYAQDRLARRGRQSEELFELFELHGIRFVAIADGTDIVPAVDGALIARIRAAVASEEIRKLKRRLNDALEQNRERGRRHGKIPFGWNADGSPHAIQAGMIIDATERVLRGESMASIVAEWNDNDMPRPSWVRRSRDGEKLPEDEQVTVAPAWKIERLRQMLERPANAGIYEHKGARLEVQPQWVPLISEEQYAALSARFARARTGAKSSYLLGGLLICGRCNDDAPMWGVTNRSEGYIYYIYRCSKCNHQVKIAPTDDYVTYTIVETLAQITPADLADPGKVSALTDINLKITLTQQRLTEIEDRYSDVMREDAIDANEHARLTGKIKPLLGKLTAERERLLDESSEATVLRGLIGPDAEHCWEGASLEVKREAIRLLAHLVVLPGTRHTPIEDRISIVPARAGLGLVRSSSAARG